MMASGCPIRLLLDALVPNADPECGHPLISTKQANMDQIWTPTESSAPTTTNNLNQVWKPSVDTHWRTEDKYTSMDTHQKAQEGFGKGKPSNTGTRFLIPKALGVSAIAVESRGFNSGTNRGFQ
jgi:hypothetical protein